MQPNNYQTILSDKFYSSDLTRARELVSAPFALSSTKRSFLLNGVYILGILILVCVGLAYRQQARELSSRLESMEERSSRISVVLRYLLDEAKKEAQKKFSKDQESEVSSMTQSDLPVARVLAPRLNLRVGPGLNSAPLMTVGEGTLLVVEDDSNLNWLRVVAPNGARAFALKSEVEIDRNGK